MRSLLVAHKLLVELAREPKLAAVLFLLPLSLVLVSALGYSTPLLRTHVTLTSCSDGPCDQLVAELRGQRYADSRPMFDIRAAENAEEADRALRAGTAVMLVTSRRDAAGNMRVALRGDGAQLAFTTASALAEKVYDDEMDRRDGRPIVDLRDEPLADVAPRTELDASAAGLFVFAIMMLTPWSAMVLSREVRQRTLQRLRLTRLSAFELLGGVALAMMIVAAMQGGLVTAGAAIGGFDNHGTLAGTLLSWAVLAFSAIGWGLLVASVTKSDSQAGNVGGAVMMVQVFLSGAFFPMPSKALVVIGGHELGSWDVLPATHCMSALRSITNEGLGASDVAFRLGAGAALSLVVFAVGVSLFHTRHMRANR